MTEPIKIISGKFTLYQTPKGGMHLSMHADGEEEPRHIEIPAMMVKMMMRKASRYDNVLESESYGEYTREVITNGLVDSETVSVPDFVDDPNGEPGE